MAPAGSPVPPPHYVKQRALRGAAKQYGLARLIETGTFLGDMLAAMREDFDNLTSIELSDELYARATKRFAADPKITLLHGDSSERIKEVAASIEEPALFWLDAHYSGAWHEEFDETAGSDRPNPIYAELEAVFASPYKHVVFIDDARLFNGEEGWPQLADVCSFIEEREPERDLARCRGLHPRLPRPSPGLPGSSRSSSPARPPASSRPGTRSTPRPG